MVAWTFVPLDYAKRDEGSEVFVVSETPFKADDLGKTTQARDKERQRWFEELLRNIAWHLGTQHVPVFVNFNGDKRRMDKGCVGHAVAARILELPKDSPEGYVVTVTLSQPGVSARQENLELVRFKQDYRAYVLSKYRQFDLTLQTGGDKEYYFRATNFPTYMRFKHSFTKSSVILVFEGRWKDVASTALSDIPDSMWIERHERTLDLATKTDPIDFTAAAEKQTHLIDAAMQAAVRLLPCKKGAASRRATALTPSFGAVERYASDERRLV
jgi:hypothetical protein